MRPFAVLFLVFGSSRAVQNRQYQNVDAIPLTDDNIQSAVQLWYDADENDRAQVEQLYGGPIESWDLSAVTSLEEAFLGLDHFQADLSEWNVAGVTNMRACFYNTTGFAGQVEAWDVSNVQDMRVLLAYSEDFQDDIGQWNTTSLQNLRAAFTEYSNTGYTDETLPLSKWQTPNLLDLEGVFAGTRNFQTDLSGWDTSKVTSMAFMLEKTVNFYGGDLSLLDTSSVVTMEGMFQSAVNVRGGRKISDWDTSSLQDMHRMFYHNHVIYQDDTPDDVFIFYLCWDLSTVSPETLRESFCHGSSGGFNCDCVPDDMKEFINSGCNDSKLGKHCYGSLGEGEEDQANALAEANEELDHDASLEAILASGATVHRPWVSFLLPLCLGLAASRSLLQ